MHKNDLVPKFHPAYKRLLKVMEKILIANKDLKSMRDTQWTLTVISTPLKNSYILPVCILLCQFYIAICFIFVFKHIRDIFILFLSLFFFVFLGWKYFYFIRHFENS